MQLHLISFLPIRPNYHPNPCIKMHCMSVCRSVSKGQSRRVNKERKPRVDNPNYLLEKSLGGGWIWIQWAIRGICNQLWWFAQGMATVRVWSQGRSQPFNWMNSDHSVTHFARKIYFRLIHSQRIKRKVRLSDFCCWIYLLNPISKKDRDLIKTTYATI